MPRFKITNKATGARIGIAEGPNAADAWANHCDANKSWPSPRTVIVEPLAEAPVEAPKAKAAAATK